MTPSHIIEPKSGFSRPDTMLRSVDFPIPLEPVIRPTLFFSISKFKFLIKKLPFIEKSRFFTNKLIFI